MDDLLAELAATQPQRLVAEVVGTLRSVAGNIVKAPAEVKYRVLKRKVPKLNRLVFSVEPALSLFLLAGFAPHNSGADGECLVYEGSSPTDLDALRELAEMCDALLLSIADDGGSAAADDAPAAAAAVRVARAGGAAAAAATGSVEAQLAAVRAQRAGERAAVPVAAPVSSSPPSATAAKAAGPPTGAKGAFQVEGLSTQLEGLSIICNFPGPLSPSAYMLQAAADNAAAYKAATVKAAAAKAAAVKAYEAYKAAAGKAYEDAKAAADNFAAD